jgi:hypothetical protein
MCPSNPHLPLAAHEALAVGQTTGKAALGELIAVLSTGPTRSQNLALLPPAGCAGLVRLA